MRIVLHGSRLWPTVLEKLLERGEDIVAVCCAPTRKMRQKMLATYAKEKAYQCISQHHGKHPGISFDAVFNADVCMMAYVLLFVPNLCLTPKYGTFQYHPSLCPLHRGPSSINWPIAMGKDRTGLSIFWPDDGLDEGPIMLQRHVRLGLMKR